MSGSLGSAYGSPVFALPALAAVGTSQGSAFPIVSQVSNFTSVPSGTGCVLPAIPGRFTIINAGANTLAIYPPSGQQFTGQGLNASYPLLPGQTVDMVWLAGPQVSPIPTPWQALGANFINGGTVTGPLKVTGLLFESAAAGISAAGSNQAGATALTAEINAVTAVSAGQGVALMPASAGLDIYIVNLGTVPLQVYGNLTDTIDSSAGSVGVSQMVKSNVIYSCASTGTWVSNGLATGYSPTGLQTMQPTDNITAAGSTQATATQLTSLINNVATVAAGSGVNLPQSAAGLSVVVENTGATGVQVYPVQGGTDTINGIAAGTIGIFCPPGGVGNFLCTNVGTWSASGTNPKLVNYMTNIASAAATLTAASLTPGAVQNHVDMIGSLAGGAALTLPTVASYLAALPYANVNAGSVVRILNHSAGAQSWTLTANGSFAVTGTATVAQNTWRDFNVFMVNGTSAVAQDIGGGNII